MNAFRFCVCFYFNIVTDHIWYRKRMLYRISSIQAQVICGGLQYELRKILFIQYICGFFDFIDIKISWSLLLCVFRINNPFGFEFLVPLFCGAIILFQKVVKKFVIFGQ